MSVEQEVRELLADASVFDIEGYATSTNQLPQQIPEDGLIRVAKDLGLDIWYPGLQLPQAEGADSFKKYDLVLYEKFSESVTPKRERGRWWIPGIRKSKRQPQQRQFVRGLGFPVEGKSVALGDKRVHLVDEEGWFARVRCELPRNKIGDTRGSGWHLKTLYRIEDQLDLRGGFVNLPDMSEYQERAAMCLRYALVELSLYNYWKHSADHGHIYLASAERCVERAREALQEEQQQESIIKAMAYWYAAATNSGGPVYAPRGYIAIAAKLQKQLGLDTVAVPEFNTSVDFIAMLEE